MAISADVVAVVKVVSNFNRFFKKLESAITVSALLDEDSSDFSGSKISKTGPQSSSLELSPSEPKAVNNGTATKPAFITPKSVA